MQYTVSRTKRLMALYPCCHCGEMNVQEVHVSKSSRFEGTFTQRGLEQRHLRHEAKLEVKVTQICRKLMEKPGAFTFLRAQMHCRCHACGRKQPWSSFRTKLLLLALVFTALSCAAICTTLAYRTVALDVLRKLHRILPWALGLLALMVIGALLYYIIMLSWTRRLLGSDTPPLFAWTLEELTRKAEAYSAYAHAAAGGLSLTHGNQQHGAS